MKWLKNISENLVAKAASPLAEEGLIDKDIVKQAVIYNDPEARKQIEDAHKVAATGSVIGTTLAFPATRKLATKIITHPITEAIGTVTGLHNLVTDQGVKKTIDHVKNEEYGKASLSALGDALDASPIIGGIKGLKTGYKALRAGESIKDVLKTTIDNLPITKFKRILSKENRAKHAFITINPFGYQNPFRRGVKWLDSVLADRPVDLNAAVIDINKDAHLLFPHADVINKNREDAWRIYNGLEQKYNTYVKNADGTYSYNLEEVMKRRPDNEINFRQDANNRHGYDDIGSNHGGLTGRVTVDMGNGKQVHYIEDTWDLHPFNRQSDRITTRLLKSVGLPVGELSLVTRGTFDVLGSSGLMGKTKANRISTAINNQLNKISDWTFDARIPKFDNWLANLEAGKIIGGTPFVMKTRIPTKTVWEVVDGNPVPKMVYDDAVDYIIPKEPLQLKLNFEDFTNSLENIK